MQALFLSFVINPSFRAKLTKKEMITLSIRTDLALEALEASPEEVQKDGEKHGVSSQTLSKEGFTVTRVDILDDTGEQALGKPCGAYLTLSLDVLCRREADAFPRACRSLAALLGDLMPQKDGPVLIAGLGNRAITPDAIGPFAAEHILATRHLTRQVPEHFADWRPVSVIAPGVLGQTGLESAEVLHGLIDTVAPAAVIVVDALACGRLSRICRTIQVTDTGIVPGSGVGNARAGLNRDTLGVPVIAIGVPTVVDGATLAHEIRAQSPQAEGEALSDLGTPVIVTSRDIDRDAADIARVIGYAVNLALHPHLTVSDIDLYLS